MTPCFTFFFPVKSLSPPNITFSSRSTQALTSTSLQTKRARRRDGEEKFEFKRSDARLEEEIFEFMRNSKKPDAFPTKAELISAGRRDLAVAVASHGGWLALGWDLKKEDSFEVEIGNDFNSDYFKYKSDFNSGYKDYQIGVHPNYSEASFSGRSMEEQEERREKGGIEGILKGLERERNLLHLSKPKKRIKNNGRAHYNKPEIDPGDIVSLKNRRPIEIKEANKQIKIIGSQNGKFSVSNGSNGSVNSICEKWTKSKWSISRDNSSINNIKADEEEIIDIDNNNNNNNNNNNENNNNTDVGPNFSEGIDSLSLEREEIKMRLQHIESNLNSALKSLRFKVKHVLSQNLNEGTNNEISDDWEFRETEIMKSKTEVRSLRASLSVLEGKMALKIIEAQKLLEEHKKRLEFNQKAMFGLKTVSIIWPNPACEVLLAGSFNGWTNQRTMEKTKEGLFSLNLTLYPGQYEIKFIVDGVWKIDPLRPVVHNNGHENNLLTVN